nr:F-box/FBD/LRR-repeat protein At1g13570-like [Tanacetum cinerariifolium]
MVRKTRKASNSIPVDIISTMPDNVLSNILNRLPIHHAIRTSILSKSWRLNWTLITQLVFDSDFFYYFFYGKDVWEERVEGKIFDGRSLSRILLHLKGIQEFTIEAKDYMSIANVGILSIKVPYLRSWKLLMEFPPKLEELTLDFCKCKAKTIAENRVSSSVLFCVKSLTLRNVDFRSGIEASSIFQLIFSSPNLLTLEIEATFETEGPQSALNYDFASMRQLQLQSVYLQFIRDSKNEVCLIKSLLACSPVLQKMVLFFVPYPLSAQEDKAKLAFALKLLKLKRTSPIAQIEFY